MEIHDLLSVERMEHLLDGSGAGPCLSLYMPTFRAGLEVRQNSVRFKNLLEEARKQLAQFGLRGSDATKILEPLEVRQRDTWFWNHQSDGLAVFHGPDQIEAFRVPLDPGELVVVGKRFHLKPLFPLLSCDGRFFLLAVSQKEARLFECSRHSWSEVKVDNMPAVAFLS